MKREEQDEDNPGRDVLRRSTIHGLKYLVYPNVHTSEKLFWITSLIISWYLSTQLGIASYNAYYYYPIKFVVETTYVNWETDFPAVIVCESENGDRIEEASDFLWSPSHDFNLEEVLKEIAFFKGVGYYMQLFCTDNSTEINCPQNNFTYYASAVRSKCRDMLQNCTWNNEFFDCCEYFVPMETELGICYGINSVQSKIPKDKRINMVSNRKTGPGSILFNVLVTASVFVLSSEEVPSLTTLNSDIILVIGQQYYKRHISVKSMENDPQGRGVNVDVRRCKYPDEYPLSVYPYYSYSACTVECRKKAQLATCNCTSFYSPYTPQKYHCGAKGISCLHDNYNKLSILKAKWSNRNGLYCDCVPSCQGLEITVIADDRTSIDDELSIVEISMDFLPQERSRRNIVRGSLDLVVSIGATVGLLIGASMLSVFEILYFLYRAFVRFIMIRIRKRSPSVRPLIPRRPANMPIVNKMPVMQRNPYIPRKLYYPIQDNQRNGNIIIVNNRLVSMR